MTPEQQYQIAFHAGLLVGWNSAAAAIVALIRDRSAAYYGQGSEALAAAIEAGEHLAYAEVKR